MKKMLIGIVVAVILIVGVGTALLTIDFNRINKDNYYVLITEDGVLEQEKLGNGEVYKRYNYKVNAVDDKGQEKNLEFFASKNLKHGAYLKLYVKGDSVVTSYDEVKESEVPDKVKK